MSNIPKVIHYCWFGRNPLPESAIKCINSWRKFFPDYEIKEWNEDNFDVNIIPYTAEAFSVKKYAFVSDYARIWILYHFGGIYFDTDVEVIKQMDVIIARGGFMGIEICSEGIIKVNPGLGIACEPNNVIYRDILNVFEETHFLLPGGHYNYDGIVPITTDVLLKYGLTPNDSLQQVDDLYIYPKNFFNPYDYTIDKLDITNETYSIHWYGNSWAPTRIKLRLKISVFLRKIIRIIKK